jgi:hypothetical protein
MTHPSDVSAQLAFIGLSDDDKRWKAEKKRKHAKKAQPIPAPDGAACCALCGHWRRPEDVGGFGHCRKLVTVRSRVKYGPEPGTTLGLEDVMTPVEFDWEFMRTRAGFLACSRYEEKAKEAAA